MTPGAVRPAPDSKPPNERPLHKVVQGITLRGNTIRIMKLAVLSARCITAAAIVCGSPGCATGISPAAGAPNGSGAAAFRLIQEPEDGYQFAGDLIANATTSIRMTMYELADQSVIEALGEAAKRGITVKVILDEAFHGHTTNENAYTRLRADGVAVKWAPLDIIYHQKTIAVDDSTAAISTANLVPRYYQSSRDAVIVTTDRRDVAAITATFDADFARPAGTPPAATAGPHLVWAPDATAAFVHHISAATATIDIETEELTDRDVIAAISGDARRGIACRIVMTADTASTRALAQVTAAGCSVHLMPRAGDQLYIHEKAILTDITSQLVGSHNLSPKSLRENRELSTQLDSRTAPDVVAAVHATFDHDYQQAPPAPNSDR